MTIQRYFFSKLLRLLGKTRDGTLKHVFVPVAWYRFKLFCGAAVDVTDFTSLNTRV
jgi:hypothetical protein